MGKLYQRDGKYGIDFRDAYGQRVRKVVAADKGVAMKLLADAMSAAEKVKAGVVNADPRESKRPIQEQIDRYLSDLGRKGRDPMYAYIVGKRLEAAVAARGWACLRDCTMQSVSAYLRELFDDGKSARTVNAHRADLSAFFNWCTRNGAIEGNPCENVAKSAVPRDKRRRALALSECQALMKAAPDDRRFCYITLLYTGLRRAEAAALCWGHLHLDVANPFVELPGSITKSGRPESVPLVPEVAEALKERRGKVRDAVFASIPSMEEFRKDLAAAEIAEEDERGRKVVLHSLRHSLATLLAKSQVPPAIAMKILRHRDIRLTLEAYTDDSLLPITAAMAALPTIGGVPTTKPMQIAAN